MMRSKKNADRQKGITLIELLITISIVSLLFTTILSLFKEGLISYDRSLTETEIQLDIRHIQDVIRSDILASKIGKFDDKTFPTIDTDHTLTLFTGTSDAPDYIIYYVEDDSLIREKDGKKELILVSINSSSIEINENNLVTVSIEKKVKSSYANQFINKVIFIQAKPRGVIKG